MTGIDLFIIVVLLAGAVWGYSRGLVVQLGSLVAFAVALVACRVLGDVAAHAVMAMMGTDETAAAGTDGSMKLFMASCIGHVALFVIVWAGVWLLARTLKMMAKALHLGLLDGIGGGLFMVLKAGVIISFILNFARFVAPNSALAQSQSAVTEAVAKLAPALLGYIQPMT
ncbi:MAG: CvpA family protein [Firmicutes bacterium]|nr:CvpA family protein [Bacillota bacterium]MCM1400519.1 CvpA family protein [Bacteroides sp.]MCM1476423.1 CvpA family protein [Bacteroides sp.]